MVLDVCSAGKSHTIRELLQDSGSIEYVCFCCSSAEFGDVLLFCADFVTSVAGVA